MNFCPFIDTTLIFTEDCITPCYTNFSDKTPYYLSKNLKERKNLNLKDKKENLIKIINSSEIKKFACNNCCHLTTNETKFKQYNHFIISLWQNKSFTYNFLEAIQKVYKTNIVDKDNLIIEIQSGNISDIENLDKIISIFNKNGFKEIQFMINNVIYHPMIEKVLQEGRGSLYIIPNIRNDELKNREFDIKNTLRRYLGSSKDKNAITVYYELIQGINDNKDDVTNFIRTMYTCGLNKISLRLDNNNINQWLHQEVPLKDCPKHLSDLILLFFKLCKKYSFYVDLSYTEQNIVFKKIFKSNKK